MSSLSYLAFLIIKSAEMKYLFLVYFFLNKSKPDNCKNCELEFEVMNWFNILKSQIQ